MPIHHRPKGQGGGQFLPGQHSEQIESEVPLEAPDVLDSPQFGFGAASMSPERAEGLARMAEVARSQEPDARRERRRDTRARRNEARSNYRTVYRNANPDTRRAMRVRRKEANRIYRNSDTAHRESELWGLLRLGAGSPILMPRDPHYRDPAVPQNDPEA